jgi:two-component system, NtrC family, response regulator AtoC
MDYRIMAIDDEQDFLDSVKRGLITSGFKDITLERDPKNAVSFFARGEHADLALIDVTMPGMSGVEVLEAIKCVSPKTECIMVTASNEARLAVECLKKGAYDYLVKPVSREDLVLSVNRALERRRLLDILDLGKKKGAPKLEHPEAFKHITTRSPEMFRILKEAELHARSDVPVLITGESGTGKELLARAIHQASLRTRFPFTPVNMASLNSTLFDAEFFGHTKGAFTGAEKERAGYLEHTHRGTLFMDEIGNLPFEMQGKLLRVLQEGEYLKLGTSQPRKADIRFITATNADLERLMAKGLFRKDLFYRLKGAWLNLPPLRERRDDIPLLIDRFVEEFHAHRGGPGVEEEALSALVDYEYPGNIRELRNMIQSAVNLAKDRPISSRLFPDHLRKQKKSNKKEVTERPGTVSALAEAEKAHILMVYEQTGRNKAQTSDLLGIGLNTLRRKLRSYGIH